MPPVSNKVVFQCDFLCNKMRGGGGGVGPMIQCFEKYFLWFTQQDLLKEILNISASLAPESRNLLPMTLEK